jgi:hypothetical protein
MNSNPAATVAPDVFTVTLRKLIPFDEFHTRMGRVPKSLWGEQKDSEVCCGCLEKLTGTRPLSAVWLGGETRLGEDEMAEATWEFLTLAEAVLFKLRWG